MGIACIALVMGIYTALADVIIFKKGEVKKVWIEIYDRDYSPFNIQTDALYWVEDDGGAIFTNATDATIVSNRIWGLVDSASWTEGSGYKVFFKWGVEGDIETYYSLVKATCGEEWL